MVLGSISALGHALMFRYGHAGSIWIWVSMGALMQAATRLSTSRSSQTAEAFVIAAGLAALAVAAFVNHRTLTRSTSTSKAYRRESMPFGLSAPGAQR
jgi:mannose/fructose/N-acetylgalactosamine-specific phosphotransferase system component IIC